MSKWYLAEWPESTSMAKIIEVEVLKCTSASVWVDGRRQAKHSTYQHYFESKAEAVQCVVDAQNGKISYYEAQIAAHRHQLGRFQPGGDGGSPNG